jgi:hypothetical protein
LISVINFARFKVIIPLTLAALFVAVPAVAQDRRGAEILTFDEYFRLAYHTQPYVLEWHTGKGGLLYFGASHSFDPTDRQILSIERCWRRFHPDIAFVEGRDPENQSPIKPDGTREEVISRWGESGFTVFMAFRYGVPVRTIEPSRSDEIKLLLKQGYSPEQIKLFYVLREIPRFRDKKQEQTIESYVENNLDRMSLRPEPGGEPRTLPEFEASVARHFPKLKDWREVPESWFNPALPKPHTFLNVMSLQLSEFRDRHMVDLLVDQVKRGKWVFAVVRASHVVMQEAALRAALETR